MLKKLNSFKLPEPKGLVVADASFDPRTGKAVIGYSDDLMLNVKSATIRCSDNNVAELKAVELAARDLEVWVEILTDSQYAIDNFKGKHIVRKTNRDNVANTVVRLKKENKRKV